MGWNNWRIALIELCNPPAWRVPRCRCATSGVVVPGDGSGPFFFGGQVRLVSTCLGRRGESVVGRKYTKSGLVISWHLVFFSCEGS